MSRRLALVALIASLAACSSSDPTTTPQAEPAQDGGVTHRDADVLDGGPAPSLTHGPVLGAITDRSVRVWARGDGEGRLAVRYAPVDAPDDEIRSAAVPFDRTLDRTAVVLIDGLAPDTSYRYTLETMSAGGEHGVRATEPASFHTLGPEGEPTRIRFAVGADVRGAVVPGFADVAEVGPDFVLMIGDNVYADDDSWVEGDFDASFARGQKLYQTVWGGDQFRALFSRVPVFMMWDDHEIMENYWAGKNDLRYRVGRALFDAYQGSHNPDPIDEGELYYSFRAGDIGFFVIDARTHRDGNMDDNDADKSMLGTAQRQAFEEWLTGDDSRVHVIVSSVILSDFTTTGQDPWSSFSTERDALLDVLVEHATANTFVISGDQHWSAVLELSPGELEPYSLYEFQTTPLGSGLRAAPQDVDQRVIALDNKHQVFGVFDIDTRVDPPRLDFTMCAVNEPCTPHAEPGPQSVDIQTAVLPYSMFFEGGDHGFIQREPQ
jgi:phosphodiesterase/alkaline phosphatase D-like protein